MEDDLIFGGNNYEKEKIEREKYNGGINNFEQTLLIDSPNIGMKFIQFIGEISKPLLRLKIVSTKDAKAFRSMYYLSNNPSSESFQEQINKYIEIIS